jgi:prepilin-type N-terminal cleavage/methylation domain-containing protein
MKRRGFTVLEVLVAMSILIVTLIAIYQSFSTSLFILNSTQNLWKAITHSQNELLRWERRISAPVSLAQGEFEEEDQRMFGFAWEREIEDTEPLPGIVIRRIYYRLLWQEGNSEYTYDAELYVKPTQ